MSDIKTLREAADTLKRHCIFQPTDTSDHMHFRMVQIESALEFLCRREAERMEGEAKQEPASDQTVTCDATYRLGWNAAITEARRVLDMCDQSILEFAEPQALIPYAQAVRLINALRKGPSHD